MTASHELWIFNHYASAPDQPAGTRHFDLARGLVGQGFRVTIFAAGFSHATGTETRVPPGRLYEIQVIDGVRFVWVRTVPYRGNTWRRFVNMLSYGAVVLVAQRRLQRPAAVIGSTVHPLAAAAAYIAARLRGARFLFEIRDLWPQTLVDMGVLRPGSFAARLMWWLEAVLVNRAETVITLLPGVSEYLRQRRLPTDRILYVPNGVRLQANSLEEAPRRTTETFDRLRADGRFLCGYLGAHGRANGLHVVLGAAAELQRLGDRTVHVVLIGDGPEKPDLVSTARGLGLANVTFMEPVNKNAVPAVLRQLDAGILHLSDVDVFRYGISPNKLFDYLANGLPVLFACRSGNDPIQDAQAGISLAPDDPSALAAAMLSLAALPPSERRRMGGAGRRYVEQHHDIEQLAVRLGDHIRRGTPGSGRPAGDEAHRL
jgi:glycosyltransferase involved in cell wall biosynthesis